MDWSVNVLKLKNIVLIITHGSEYSEYTQNATKLEAWTNEIEALLT